MQPGPTDHDGWVLPDCNISYITDGGSEMTEMLLAVLDVEGFHPLIPEGAGPVRVLRLEIILVLFLICLALTYVVCFFSCVFV